jgi:hypothetical protein
MSPYMRLLTHLEYNWSDIYLSENCFENPCRENESFYANYILLSLTFCDIKIVLLFIIHPLSYIQSYNQ